MRLTWLLIATAQSAYLTRNRLEKDESQQLMGNEMFQLWKTEYVSKLLILWLNYFC